MVWVWVFVPICRTLFRTIYDSLANEQTFIVDRTYRNDFQWNRSCHKNGKKRKISMCVSWDISQSSTNKSYSHRRLRHGTFSTFAVVSEITFTTFLPIFILFLVLVW